MNIRLLEGGEKSCLVDIFNQARSSAGCFGSTTHSLEQFLEQIQAETLYVAEIAQEIAGFVSVWEPDRFIHHLYVSPTRQRSGIGRALIDHCKSIYGLPLSLKCIQANTAACGFYEKHGWVVKSADIGPDGPYNYYWLEQVNQDS